MSPVPSSPPTRPHRRTRIAIWLMVAAGLAVLFFANAHLIFVAISSEPACVAHLRLGEGAGGRDGFGAAQSTCAPAERAVNGRRGEKRT